MKAFRIGTLATSMGLGLAPATPAQPAAPTPTPITESVRVSLVQVPVTVVDGDGRSVSGLTISDFEVRDDGKPVALDSVDAIEYPRRHPENTPPHAESAPGPPAASLAALRKFLLLFDLTFASSAELQRTFQAATRFVREQMGEQDIAAIATVSAGGGLKALQQFTPDRSRLAEVLDRAAVSDEWERARPPSEGASASIHSDVRTSLSQDHDRYRRQLASRLLGSLEKLAGGLERIPGRKHVVLFSHGFDPQLLTGSTALPSGPRDLKQTPFGDTDTFGDSGLRAELDRLHESFRRHDAVIHAIDLGGVGGTVADAAGQRVGTFGRNRESLAAIARGTGGALLTDSNDFGTLLERVLEKTHAVYLLHFVPAATAQSGRFHTLKVKVLRRGARIFVRSGYFERAAGESRPAPSGQR